MAAGLQPHHAKATPAVGPSGCTKRRVCTRRLTRHFLIGLHVLVALSQIMSFALASACVLGFSPPANAGAVMANAKASPRES